MGIDANLLVYCFLVLQEHFVNVDLGYTYALTIQTLWYLIVYFEFHCHIHCQLSSFSDALSYFKKQSIKRVMFL